MAYPLRLGEDAWFARVRDYLRAADYREAALTARFGVSELHQLTGGFDRQRQRYMAELMAPDAAALLTRLFCTGLAAAEGEVRAAMPDAVREAFESLGLLARLDNGDYSAPVLLYPLRSLWIASDRYAWPDGRKYYGGDDFVYLALSPGSQHLVEMLPPSRCRAFLELGTGAGNAALVGALSADWAWGTDITARAVYFAEFNRRLNGIGNASFGAGDLYEPVAGRRFDRIAAQPPFEPEVQPGAAYSLGGSDGEQVTRRIVEGLADYLEAGGRFYGLLLASDREEEPFEQRVRQWLGEAGGEFDVLVAVRSIMEPMEYAAETLNQRGIGVAGLDAWEAFFARYRVQSCLYGHLILQRRAEERPVFTARRRLGPGAGSGDVEWLLDFETRRAAGRLADWLCGSRPVLAEGAELLVRHAVEDGRLLPREYTFRTTHPFVTEMHCRSWMAFLASRCDGKTAAAEHLAALRAQGAVPGPEPEEHFYAALAALIAGGFVKVG